jgi:type I restriction enzyme S subunit
LLLKLKKTRSSAIDAAPRNFSEPFSLPSSWQWTNLQFLMSPDETFCYGVVQPGLDDPKGVLLIRAGDLKKGTVDLTNLRRIPIVVDAEYRRSKLKGGEILVTVVGAGIGESSIAPQIAAGCNIARAVAKLPIREISAEYVHFWMLSSTAIQMMKGDAREVARPTLNLEQLKYLPVPIPGLDEQAEIVRRVKALFALADRIEARCTVARAQAQRLAPLVLAKAFRGELVPQDPNDEPTSELLARIGFAKNAVALSNKYALVARGRTARKDAPKLATSNHAAAP